MGKLSEKAGAACTAGKAHFPIGSEAENPKIPFKPIQVKHQIFTQRKELEQQQDREGRISKSIIKSISTLLHLPWPDLR